MVAGGLERSRERWVVDGIFISYRREDSAGYAGRLYDRLAAHFGAERVFMDVEGIAPGTDFVEAIERAVTSCKVLIVLIGDEWLEIQDNSGQRRLDDPNDFIRLETSTALKRDIRVVPVLLEDARMPRGDELPEDLSGLSRRQAIEISHKQWDASTGNLIEALDKIYFPETAQVSRQQEGDHHPDPGPDTPVRRWRRWAAGGLVMLVLAGGWLASRWLMPGPTGGDQPDGVTHSATMAPSLSDGELKASPPGEAGPGENLSGTDKAVVVSDPDADPRTGQEKEPVVVPLVGRLEIQPRQIDYGTMTLGTPGRAEIRLINSGDAELAVPVLTGAEAEILTIVQECPDKLAPGQSCRAELVVKPLTAGALDIRLPIGQAEGQPLSISLIGQVVEKRSPPVEEPILAGKLPPVVTAKPAPPVVAAKPAPPVVATKPAPPVVAPKPVPSPKILQFNSKVNGHAVELCYRVSGAEQVVIRPRPGRLNNPRRGCVTVSIGKPTRFNIVARGADHRASDSLLVVPESTPVPPVDPAPIADDPTADSPVNSRLPNPGDQWTYRVRGRWASSPKQTIEVSVLSATPSQVREQLSTVEGGESRLLGQRRLAGPLAYVTGSSRLGSEFSPYLNAYGGVAAQSKWKGITTPDTNSFWTNWYSTGEVDGQERVTVPAGTFDALKLELWSSRAATGGHTQRDVEPVRIHYYIWYAAGIKRYVKMVRTTTAASGQRINTDTIELLSYRQQ